MARVFMVLMCLVLIVAVCMRLSESSVRAGNVPAEKGSPSPKGAENIDLLKLVDFDHDVVHGRWRRTADGFQSQGDSESRIRIRYRPPAEYDFSADFTVDEAPISDVNLMCSAKDRGFLYMMGAFNNTCHMLASVNGVQFGGNPTMVRHPDLLVVGQNHHAVVQVRLETVRAFLDGQLITEWAPENGVLAYEGHWAIGANVLGFGSNNHTTFHSISFRDMTGAAKMQPTRAVKGAKLRALRALIANQNNLIDGLGMWVEAERSLLGEAPPASSPVVHAPDPNKTAAPEVSGDVVISRTYDVSNIVNPLKQQDGNDTESSSRMKIAGLVTQNIAPETWKDHGGKIATLQFAGNALSITQSARQFPEIESLLAQCVPVDQDTELKQARTTLAQQTEPLASLRSAMASLEVKRRAAGKDKERPRLPWRARRAPETGATEERLNSIMTEVWQDRAFGVSDWIDVICTLSGMELGTDLVVNWKALGAAGVRPDTPVFLHLRGATLNQTLLKLLEQAGGKPNLVFDVDNGVIVISTSPQRPSTTSMRVYDVMDAFGTQATNQDIENLMRTIMKTIAPETWKGNGGAFGTIQERLGTKLFITQLWRVHWQIEAKIDAMRLAAKLAGDEAPPTPTTGPAGILPVPASPRVYAVLAVNSLELRGLKARVAEQTHEIDDLRARAANIQSLLGEAPTTDVTAVHSQAPGKITVPAGSADAVITRIYDVSNIVSPLMRQESKSTQRAICGQIAGLIMQDVAPQTWKDQGGKIGTLQVTGNKLSITQSARNFPGIESMLEECAPVDQDAELRQARATVSQQNEQVATWRSAVANLEIKCRAAGKKLPPIERATQSADPEKELEKILREVAFDGVGFGDVVDFFGDVGRSKMIVNWKAVGAAGVGRNTPVMLHLRNVTLNQAISRLLEQVGGNPKLVFDIDNGALVISPNDQRPSNTIVRVYDLNDALPAPATTQDIENLIRIITKTIAPETWRENGGVFGAIQGRLGTKLFITQTWRVHRLIQEKIDALRLSPNSAAATPDAVPSASSGQMPHDAGGLAERMAKMPPPDVQGNWVVENDALVLAAASPRKNIFFGDPTWKDYDFRVKVIVDSITPSEFGLIVRSLDDKQHWTLFVGDLGNMANRDLVPFSTLDNGWNSPSRRWMPNRQAIKPGQTLVIEMRVRDDQITVLSDGAELTRSSCGALKEGRTGLWSCGSTRFSEMEIRDPQGRLLWKGLPLAPASRPTIIAPPLAKKPAVASENHKANERVLTPHLAMQPLVGHNKDVYRVIFSPNGRFIVSTGDDGQVVIWDAVAGNQVKRYDQRQFMHGLAFDRVGKILVSAGMTSWGRGASGCAMVRNMESGVEVPLWSDSAGAFSCVSVEASGRFIAAGGADRALRIFDLTKFRKLDNGKVATENAEVLPSSPALPAEIRTLAFNPQRLQIVVGTSDGSIREVKLDATGVHLMKPSFDGHSREVRCLAFSPDGKLLGSCGDDGTLRLWDANSGKLKLKIDASAEPVQWLAFSPDGKLLASAQDDKRIGLWRVSDGESRGYIEGHTAGVLGVDFSHDGLRVASCGRDFTVQIWDLYGHAPLKAAKQ